MSIFIFGELWVANSHRKYNAISLFRDDNIKNELNEQDFFLGPPALKRCAFTLSD